MDKIKKDDKTFEESIEYLEKTNHKRIMKNIEKWDIKSLELKPYKNFIIYKFGDLFKLYLPINIKDNVDYYTIKSKGFKIKINSTNNNIHEAKKEFEDVLKLILSKTIRDKTTFKIINYYKIKHYFLNNINKNKKIPKHSMVLINTNEIMFSKLIDHKRIIPEVIWYDKDEKNEKK